MGSRSKDGKGGDDGEGSEGDEAEPVEHLQDCHQLGLFSVCCHCVWDNNS